MRVIALRLQAAGEGKLEHRTSGRVCLRLRLASAERSHAFVSDEKRRATVANPLPYEPRREKKPAFVGNRQTRSDAETITLKEAQSREAAAPSGRMSK